MPVYAGDCLLGTERLRREAGGDDGFRVPLFRLLGDDVGRAQAGDLIAIPTGTGVHPSLCGHHIRVLARIWVHETPREARPRWSLVLRCSDDDVETTARRYRRGLEAP